MITASITADNHPDLRAAFAHVTNPRAALKVLGRRVSNDYRRRFRDFNGSRKNKLGAKRSNFWLEVSRSVQNPRQVSDSAVLVSITHPAIAQKIFGGVITPKRAKSLSIPSIPAAYDRAPAVLERELSITLFRLKSRGGSLFLAAATASGVVKVFYALKRSVNQSPEPGVLFGEQETTARLLNELDQFNKRQLNKQK
jgi:hypothetical protein